MMIGVDGLQIKKKTEDWPFDGREFLLHSVLVVCLTIEAIVYGVDPDDTRYGFEDEVRVLPPRNPLVYLF